MTRGATTHRLKAPVWPEEEGSHESGGQSRGEYGGSYRKLDDDGGTKRTFKSARGRTEDGRDVKRSAVINDNSGWLITESKEVLRIWGDILQGAAERKRISTLHRPPEFGWEREVEVEEIGQEEMKQQCTR